MGDSSTMGATVLRQGLGGHGAIRPHFIERVIGSGFAAPALAFAHIGALVAKVAPQVALPCARIADHKCSCSVQWKCDKRRNELGDSLGLEWAGEVARAPIVEEQR